MPPHQPRIIVIEDHPLVRAGQRMLLEAAGYHVTEIAAPADLAHFTFASGAGEAIIADFDLGPGMSGLEVALEIMQRAGRRIPTLILSASFGDRSMAAAEEYDITVMFKPAPEESVLAWVETVLRQDPAAPESAGEPPP